MNYGIILASGKGTRINDQISLPKQFRDMNGVPVIIYTMKQMLKINRFDYLYVVVPKMYKDYTFEIIDKYITNEKEKIKIIVGGKERMDSIENAINAICNNNVIGEDDVIVIHDAVRPFVTEQILNDSIDAAREHDAVVTAVPVSDTLLVSKSGNVVDEIPQRSLYYKGQSPDSFKLKLFTHLLEQLKPEDRKVITGTSQVCTLNHYPIYMIPGDEVNFKITTSSDFIIANSIVKDGEYND